MSENILAEKPQDSQAQQLHRLQGENLYQLGEHLLQEQPNRVGCDSSTATVFEVKGLLALPSEFSFSLLVPSQPSYLSKSFCFQGFLVSKAAVPGGSTGGSQRVAVSQGLPVWEIDAAHAAERRHPALLRALQPAPVEGDLVGAAGAGCCSRRGVYAGPHPSGRAVGVPPAAAPGDGCSIRPQSHPAKSPAQQQVRLWQDAARQSPSPEGSSHQIPASQLQETQAKWEDKYFSLYQGRDSIKSQE